MHRDLMRRLLWLPLALLAACATRPAAPPPAPALQAALNGAACSAGPDGEPGGAAKPDATPDRVADRGIGGTGAPVQTADRGIGGTGSPGRTGSPGGTGIVGVVTGFASICVSGHEIAFSNDVPVVEDGAAASPATLRAGQLTAVEATGSDAALHASRIVIRHEVSGPIEEIGEDGQLRVAGQRVSYTADTWGAPGRGEPLAVGDWVAVSGLRQPDGVIAATRIDRRGRGEVTVHGLLIREGGRLRIGALQVRPAPDQPITPGVDVTATGRIGDGVLYADTLEPDLLLADPPAYFGPGVISFVIEGYASYRGGRFRLGGLRDLPVPPGLAGSAPRRAVAEFRRASDGSLAVVSLRESGAGIGPDGGGRQLPAQRPDGAGAQRFEPAPVPDRRIGAAERSGSGFGRRGATGAYGSGNARRSGDSEPLPPGSGGFSDAPQPGTSPAPGSGPAPGAMPGYGYFQGDTGDTFRHR